MMNLQTYLPSLRLVCLAIAVTVAVAPARAEAQEPAGAANSQYRKASAAVERKDWPEVRRLLLPLWEKKHTWDVAVGLGKAEWYLNNHAAGARFMAFAVANIPPKEKTQAVEGLRTALDTMKAGVGTLQISVNKDSAEVLADGQLVGSAPIETDIFLDPGPHVLEARLGNASSAKQSIEIAPGKSYTIALIVESPVAGALSTAPMTPQPAEKIVERPPTQPSPPDLGPKKEPNPSSIQPRTIALIAGAGLTAVAAGIGIGFAFKASSNDRHAKDVGRSLGAKDCSAATGAAPSACADLADSLSARDSASRVEAISLGVAAVAAVTTAIVVLAWPEPQKPNSGRFQMTPIATSHAGGLVFTGSF